MVSIITPLSTVRQDKVEKNQAHYSVMYYYKWKLQCDQNSTEEGEQEHNNNNQARAMMVLSTGAWTQVKGHKIKVTRSKVTKSRSRVTRLKCTTWFVSVGLGLSHWKPKAACQTESRKLYFFSSHHEYWGTTGMRAFPSALYSLHKQFLCF